VKLRFLWSFAAVLALAFANCRGATPEDVIWQLAAVDGAPAAADTEGRAPTLRLDPSNHKVGGTTVCNGYSGPYTLSGDSLAFGLLISTRRACGDPEMNRQEAVFLGVLEKTRTWRANGDTLELRDATGVLAKLTKR
jgi:heat shock protein HslJ